MYKKCHFYLKCFKCCIFVMAFPGFVLFSKWCQILLDASMVTGLLPEFCSGWARDGS